MAAVGVVHLADLAIGAMAMVADGAVAGIILAEVAEETVASS
jgi:hypothetical protein